MIPIFALLALLVQWPTDARELVAWHAEHVAEDPLSAPRPEEWRERLFVYQAAGAESEAWAAYAALDQRLPGDTDGQRYAIHLSAWDPARWNAGSELASDWLRRHADRPEAERATVERAQALLTERVETRRAARARQSARAFVPFAALALGAWLAWLALRTPR